MEKGPKRRRGAEEARELREIHEEMRRITEETPLEPLRIAVDAARRGELPKPDPELLKAERFILATLLLEEGWEAMNRWIDKFPPGLGTMEWDMETGITTLSPWSTDEIKIRLATPSNPYDVLTSLQEGIRDPLRHHLSQMSVTYEDALASPSTHRPTRQLRVYRRFRELLLNHTNDTPATSPKSILDAGFATAEGGIMKSLKLIPTLYERQFERSISAATLAQTFKKSLATLRLLASHHLKSPLRQRLQRLDPADFCLLGAEPEFIFEPQLRVLQGIGADPAQKSPRHACLALYAKDRHGRSIVDAVFDRYLPFLEQYYFPLFDTSSSRS